MAVVTTSSARPDALESAADGFRSSGERLHEAARSVWTAVDAYAERCSAAPLDLASPSRAGATVADGRDIDGDLRQIAAAFRAADGSGTGVGSGGLAITGDVALSATILLRHPSLGRELTGPTRAAEARGADLAAEILRTTQSGGASAAMALLRTVPRDLLSDAAFAAGLVNALGPDRIQSITEELAFRAVDWKNRHGPLFDLARLWTTATRSLDLPARARRFDPAIITTLLDTSRGRNALRALTGSSDRPAGERYLRQVNPALLHRGARLDADLSHTYALLLGHGREGHPDAAMLDASSRVPDVAVEVFFRYPRPVIGTAAIEKRTDELLRMGAGSHLAVAALLTQVLAHERFDAGTNSRDRTAILRATFEWAEVSGPTGVTEPLAQMLAGTLVTDIDFYLGRVDIDRRGELARVLQGVTEYERPWMTAILAFEHHGVRSVQDTLHGSAEARLGALHPLTRLEDSFEEAAAASDRPLDRASGIFTALTAVTDAALAGVKLHPAAALVARPLVDGALASWHDRAKESPDDHEARTRRAREGLRRRIWAVIADDPELGRRIEWAVGGTGTDRSRHLGSRITGIDDLLALTTEPADLDELAGWSAGQPEDLRAMVDAYLVGAT